LTPPPFGHLPLRGEEILVTYPAAEEFRIARTLAKRRRASRPRFLDASLLDDRSSTRYDTAHPSVRHQQHHLGAGGAGHDLRRWAGSGRRGHHAQQTIANGDIAWR